MVLIMAVNQNAGAVSKDDAGNRKKHNLRRSQLAPHSAFFTKH
jgi:hypothetical protein